MQASYLCESDQFLTLFLAVKFLSILYSSSFQPKLKVSIFAFDWSFTLK